LEEEVERGNSQIQPSMRLSKKFEMKRRLEPIAVRLKAITII